MSREKPYIAHETEYQDMLHRGIATWNERTGEPAIDPSHRRFFEDVLASSWMPGKGRMLELGCGTGPLLRWFASMGWQGTGIDVSETAIQMARQQSGDDPGRLSFHVADATKLRFLADRSFEAVIDGHCLHCLIDESDRDAALREAYRLLVPGGILILDVMARPVLAQEFRELYGTIRDGIIYHAGRNATRYEGAAEIDGIWHQPTRRLDHWQDLLKDLKQAGFDVRLFRVGLPTEAEPFTSFSAAAMRPLTEPEED